MFDLLNKIEKLRYIYNIKLQFEKLLAVRSLSLREISNIKQQCLIYNIKIEITLYLTKYKEREKYIFPLSNQICLTVI